MAYALMRRSRESGPAPLTRNPGHRPASRAGLVRHKLGGNLANTRVTLFTLMPVLQTKLEVVPPNDRFEQEADRVADQVMRTADPQVRVRSIWPARRRPMAFSACVPSARRKSGASRSRTRTNSCR
jgi:hypothetical protein